VTPRPARVGAWPTAVRSGDDLLTVPVDECSGASEVDRATLQHLMWDAAGIYRSGEALRDAAAQLGQWKVSGTTTYDLETANLLDLSRAVVAAALERRESRGAHSRSDYPETIRAFEHSLAIERAVAVPC
jgi:L-aspartate oxidase